ncbi:MAG: GNAT family N-acetyltransferase [Candidatus Odinarchaeota archaeon]
MKIIQISNKDYPNNKKSVFSYESDYYYDIKLRSFSRNNGWKIVIQKKQFKTTFKKRNDDFVFKDYLINATYYIALDDFGKEMGWISISPQKWNNTARLWDIEVDEEYRRNGVGKQLLKFAVSKAKEWNCRAIVLECQSSNFPAISFYLKNGFSLSGCDFIAYSNQDIEKHEVRLEMSRKLIYNT